MWICENDDGERKECWIFRLPRSFLCITTAKLWFGLKMNVTYTFMGDTYSRQEKGNRILLSDIVPCYFIESSQQLYVVGSIIPI